MVPGAARRSAGPSFPDRVDDGRRPHCGDGLHRGVDQSVLCAKEYREKLAVECSGALVNLTINHSVMEVRGLREPKLSRDSAAEARRIEKNFPMSVRWILAGVRADAQSSRQTLRRVTG